MEPWIGRLLKGDGQEGNRELRGDRNEQEETEYHAPEGATPAGIGAVE